MHTYNFSYGIIFKRVTKINYRMLSNTIHNFTCDRNDTDFIFKDKKVYY